MSAGKIYLADLTAYHKVLNHRNQLLKDLYVRPELKETLPVWNQQLVKYGREIIKRRRQFIFQLNEIVHGIHAKISGGKEQIHLQYEPNIEDIFFEDELSRAREKDFRTSQTSVGPHRDDLKISVDGIDVRKFGSQGQQRTCALSLKLSEIRLVEQTIHEKPVLLLDDVLSELDQSRQNYLLDSICDIQTIITCTGLDDFVRNRFTLHKVYEVIEGKVFEKADGGEHESGIRSRSDSNFGGTGSC